MIGLTYSRPLLRPRWWTSTTGAPSKLPPTRPPFARNSMMIFSFQSFASGISVSSRLAQSASPFSSARRELRAMDNDLAVVGEGQSFEVPAPGGGGCDAHVGRRPELAPPFDQLSCAVDAEVARGPRLGRDEVVDDERDLGVPGPHVEE